MFYYSLAITAVCQRQRYTHSLQWDRFVGLALFTESDDNKKNMEQQFSAANLNVHIGDICYKNCLVNQLYNSKPLR